MTVEVIGHWGGDPDRYAGRVVVVVKTQAEARDLAAVARFVRDHPAGLKVLAAAAEEAELSALQAD